MATEEQKIDEVLNEAASVGLRSRTIESAYNILQRNPNMDRVEAYNVAFNTLLTNIDKIDNRDLGTPVYVDNEDDDEIWNNDDLANRFEGIDDDDFLDEPDDE